VALLCLLLVLHLARRLACRSVASAQCLAQLLALGQRRLQSFSGILRSMQ
jgi:hypothetical protein